MFWRIFGKLPKVLCGAAPSVDKACGGVVLTEHVFKQEKTVICGKCFVVGKHICPGRKSGDALVVASVFPWHHNGNGVFKDFFGGMRFFDNRTEAHYGLGIGIFPPVITDKVTAFIEFNFSAKGRVILKEVPAKKGVSVVAVAGNDAGFRRSDNTLGNARVAFVNMLLDEADKLDADTQRGKNNAGL